MAPRQRKREFSVNASSSTRKQSELIAYKQKPEGVVRPYRAGDRSRVVERGIIDMLIGTELKALLV